MLAELEALLRDTPDAAAVVLSLAVATLVSEDLACLVAGLLIARGQLHWASAVVACFAGIYVGDLGLWLLGRLSRWGVISAPALNRWVKAAQVERLSAWLDRHLAAAIVAARVLPGSRLPLYVAAGLTGRPLPRFAGWTFVAVALWTPAVVLLSAAAGGALGVKGWVGALLLMSLGLLMLKGATRLLRGVRSRRLPVAVERLLRWEFWPAWMAYLPLVPWIAWLSLRHRGFMTVTCANPGIPLGGFVGESKHQILSRLRSPAVLPSALIEPMPLPSARRARLEEEMARLGLTYPVILKPDVGQRGVGVRLVRSGDEAARHLSCHPAAQLVQRYHPGPFEAGVFYYRLPGAARGRIFSITDKHFPELAGDGVSTLEQLIDRHPRYRLQARTFRARHAERLGQVLPAGQRLRLALAGNHCQGTLLLDGEHLITPELEGAVDQIAQSFPGFYFGRFDVRYCDCAALKAGLGFAVLELNGVTSESTNVYDPSATIGRAYATLARQWEIAFRIGASNRRTGCRPPPAQALLGAVLTHFRSRFPHAVSD